MACSARSVGYTEKIVNVPLFSIDVQSDLQGNSVHRKRDWEIERNSFPTGASGLYPFQRNDQRSIPEREKLFLGETFLPDQLGS